MIVRPVRRADLAQLMIISQQGEKGMTTLPQSEGEWLNLIERSERAFANLPKAPEGNAAFLLVLEEVNGELSGTSAIYTPLGYERPFYNYKITRIVNVAQAHNLRVQTDLLQLMNDYDGAAEVGTLILRHEYRGGGRGRLLALARYMLIAAFSDAFPDLIVAEMRGWRDPETDEIPFWDAVGKRFFKLDFDQADILSARSNNFIADLMPRIPIYTALLPDAAQAVLGKPHPNALPAYNMLIKQGFRFNNNVDIFDAGPCLEARKTDITIVRHNRLATLAEATNSAAKPTGLVAARQAENFAVAYAHTHAEHIQTAPLFYKHTGLNVSETVYYSPLDPNV